MGRWPLPTEIAEMLKRTTSSIRCSFQWLENRGHVTIKHYERSNPPGYQITGIAIEFKQVPIKEKDSDQPHPC
jgi:hypothetical protein